MYIGDHYRVQGAFVVIHPRKWNNEEWGKIKEITSRNHLTDASFSRLIPISIFESYKIVWKSVLLSLYLNYFGVCPVRTAINFWHVVQNILTRPQLGLSAVWCSAGSAVCLSEFTFFSYWKQLSVAWNENAETELFRKFAVKLKLYTKRG